MARPLLLEIIEQFLVINSTERFQNLHRLDDAIQEWKGVGGGQGISSKGKLVMTQSRQPKKKEWLFVFPPYKKKIR
jgi:hypothetical protein